MKSFVHALVFFLAMIPAISFAQDKQKTWTEQEKFHSFMSSTFHPAEEGNFQPLKEKADNMLLAAKRWELSDIPSNYDSDKTKAELHTLVKLVNAVADAVHGHAENAQLLTLITSAHDSYHRVVGECKKKDGKH